MSEKKEVKQSMGTCKDCKYWHNKQSELDYDKDYGICVCYNHKFNSDGALNDCVVLDRRNLSDKYMSVSRYENTSIDVPIGKVEKSRYCLVTGYNFGCIHYRKD